MKFRVRLGVKNSQPYFLTKIRPNVELKPTVSALFFMPKFNQKEGVMNVFSDEILEKIFAEPDCREVPCEYKTQMIHAIEKVLVRENALKEGALNAISYTTFIR